MVEPEELLLLICTDQMRVGEDRIAKKEGVAEVLFQCWQMDGSCIAAEDLVCRDRKQMCVVIGIDGIARNLVRDEVFPQGSLSFDG